MAEPFLRSFHKHNNPPFSPIVNEQSRIISTKMDVKYKAPKGGKSLLAKVAAKSGSASSRGRGGGSTKGGGGSSSSSAMHGAGGGREGRSAKIQFSSQGWGGGGGQQKKNRSMVLGKEGKGGKRKSFFFRSEVLRKGREREGNARGIGDRQCRVFLGVFGCVQGGKEGQGKVCVCVFCSPVLLEAL